MQITNPLVPAQAGGSNAAPSPVANAPHVPDSARYETSRPVTGSSQSDRERPKNDGGEDRSSQRGSRVDIAA